MKLFKYLFTVPEGEKVTDRHFKRILLSSVCGILLCMTCLMSTTWAWYTVSLQTGRLSMEVVNTTVTVAVDGQQNEEDKTSVALSAGQEVLLNLTVKTNATENSFNTAPGRYIILSVYDAAEVHECSYYLTIDTTAGLFTKTVDQEARCTVYTGQLPVTPGEDCTVFFTPAWQIPMGAKPVPSEGSLVLIDTPNDTTVPTSESTSTSTPVESTPVESTPAESTPVPGTPAESTPDESTATAAAQNAENP